MVRMSHFSDREMYVQKCFNYINRFQFISYNREVTGNLPVVPMSRNPPEHQRTQVTEVGMQ